MEQQQMNIHFETRPADEPKTEITFKVWVATALLDEAENSDIVAEMVATDIKEVARHTLREGRPRG